MDGNGLGYSTSSLKGTLCSGQSTAISNWRETGINLVIEVNEINTKANPGYAHITITFGGPDQPPPPPVTSFLGLALTLSVIGALCLGALFYMLCCCTKNSFIENQDIIFVDESYNGESFEENDDDGSVIHVGYSVK